MVSLFVCSLPDFLRAIEQEQLFLQPIRVECRRRSILAKDRQQRRICRRFRATADPIMTKSIEARQELERFTAF